MQKHTPGPWTRMVEQALPSTFGAKLCDLPKLVHLSPAIVHVILRKIEVSNMPASFSAAPDLLAALEIAEGRLMCIDAQKLDTVARNDDVIDRIRAAIAKAKGE
jgi:hypothetical protein